MEGLLLQILCVTSLEGQPAQTIRACRSFSQATIVQLDLRKDLRAIDKGIEKLGKRYVHKSVAPVLIVGLSFVQSRGLAYTFRNVGFADAMSVRLAETSGVDFTWRF